MNVVTKGCCVAALSMGLLGCGQDVTKSSAKTGKESPEKHSAAVSSSSMLTSPDEELARLELLKLPMAGMMATQAAGIPASNARGVTLSMLVVTGTVTAGPGQHVPGYEVENKVNPPKTYTLPDGQTIRDGVWREGNGDLFEFTIDQTIFGSVGDKNKISVMQVANGGYTFNVGDHLGLVLLPSHSSTYDYFAPALGVNGVYRVSDSGEVSSYDTATVPTGRVATETVDTVAAAARFIDPAVAYSPGG